jgi:CheY-like chemotaxis protein
MLQPPTAPPKTSRVLVVDDNRDSAEMMALLIGTFGHQVQVAHDGVDALAVQEAFRPDVVLLDIGLPMMSGYEVARQIRARQTPQPLLVAITGWSRDEDRHKSSAAGFDAHLVKPVDHEHLMKLIANGRAEG